MNQQNELAAVKRKIRALAAKTIDNGASEAEALLAMEKIGELLDAFNLTMDEVMLRDEPCVKKMYHTGSKHRNTAHAVCVRVSRFCQVQTWMSRKQYRGEANVVYFGLESDVDMAMYLTEILDKAAKSGYAAFKQSPEYVNFEGHRGVMSANFYDGFATRMNTRLYDLTIERIEREKKAAQYHQEQMKERMVGASDEAKVKAAEAKTGTALVSVAKDKKIEAELKRLGLTFRSAKYFSQTKGNGDAYQAGKSHADKVNLNKPIQNHGGGSFGGYLK